MKKITLEHPSITAIGALVSIFNLLDNNGTLSRNKINQAFDTHTQYLLRDQFIVGLHMEFVYKKKKEHRILPSSYFK